MGTRIRDHLRSNVVGYVAIFMFAMTGTAIATHPGGANTISSGDIINGEVKTADIGTSEVGTADITNLGVDTPDLADDAVNKNKILAGAVQTSEIGNNQVQSVDVLDENLTGTDVADGSLGAGDLGTNSVGADEIQTGAVHGDELAGTGFGNNGFNGDEEIIDGSITGFDIGANEIGGGHIADGSLSGPDIAGGLASGAAQNAAVVTLAGGAGTDVVSGTITNESTSQIIINASVELEGAASDERALCRILLDGSQISLSYESTFDDIGDDNEGTVAVNSFGNSVAPGTHTMTMNCISLGGTIVKDDAGINAIAIP